MAGNLHSILFNRNGSRNNSNGVDMTRELGNKQPQEPPQLALSTEIHGNPWNIWIDMYLNVPNYCGPNINSCRTAAETIFYDEDGEDVTER
jgi:hypothetical protein